MHQTIASTIYVVLYVLCSVIKHPQTVKRGVLQSQLRISDVYSIYPWNGISDAAIDFYIRSVCKFCLL